VIWRSVLAAGLGSHGAVALIFALLIAGCGGQKAPTPAPVVVANINSKVDIPGGLVNSFKLEVKEGQRVEGTLTVRAVDRTDNARLEVSVLVKDPSGQVALNAGKVTGSQRFAFVAAATGTYDMVLDNSISLVTPRWWR